MIVIRADQFGNQIEDWLNGRAPSAQATGVFRLVKKAVIGLGIPSLAPFRRWGEQDHAASRPAADTPCGGIAVVAAEGVGVEPVKDQRLFGLHGLRFRVGPRFDLNQLGEARAIDGRLHSIALDPAMIGAFGPTRVPIQPAQVFGNSVGLPVGLMPDWPVRFEQAFVLIQVVALKGLVERFGIVPGEGDEGLEQRIKRVVASRQRGAMVSGIASKPNCWRSRGWLTSQRHWGLN